MMIKQTVATDGPFPYAFAFTSFTQPTTGLVAYFFSITALYVPKPKVASPPTITSSELALLLALGILQGLEIGLTNSALKLLTVADRTMISSTSVLFMVLTARLWGLEQLGLLRVLSAFLMILGGVVQTQSLYQAGSGSSQLFGVLMQVVSMMLSCQRWALSQYVMQRLPPDTALGQLSKIQLLAYTLPLTGLVCIPVSLVFEPEAYSLRHLQQMSLARSVLAVAGSLVAMLYAELKLVDELSAVAFNVLSTLHQIPIVMAGIVLCHNEVSSQAAAGFGCCIAGAMVYACARRQDRQCTALSDSTLCANVDN
jgi:drug/metabolite transporter (DMT)-like permease